MEIIFYVLLFGIVYCLYQLVRNDKIYHIRINWIDTDDKRRDKYSYDEMFRPNKHNWFGLKYPNEKQYK